MATILVLDDAQHSLEELTNGLVTAGYRVTSIGEGESPVETFVTESAELVFLSLHAESVLQICEGIRETGEGAIVPIIFVGSGHATIRSPSEALSAGGDYHFDAPLDLKKIIAKVTTYVGPGDSAIANIKPTAMADDATQSDLASASDDLLAQIGAEDEEARRRDEEERAREDERQREAALRLVAERLAAEERERRAEEEARLEAEADALQREREAEAAEARRLEAEAELKRIEDDAKRRVAEAELRSLEAAEARRRAADDEKQRAVEAKQRAEREARERDEAERRAEQERAEAERRAEQERAEAERREEQERAEAERRAEQERDEAERRAERERAAAEADRLAEEAEDRAREVEARRLEEAESARLAAEADRRRAEEAEDRAREVEERRQFIEADTKRRAEEAEARRLEDARWEAELAEARRKSEAERQAVEAARLEVEEARRAAEQARREAAEERKAAEDERRKLEAERAEEQKRAAEAAANAARDAELKRQAEVAAAEAQRVAEEERRAAEEERRAAERRAEDERRAAEEERRTAERREEEERRAAERREDEERRAAERRAEEERRTAERRADEERRAAEYAQRLAEEERRAAEQAQRLADEERRTAELTQRLVDEERRIADEARKRIDEERRVAEEARRRADETQRAADEARRQLEAEAQRRLEEERRQLEAEAQRRLEDERRLIELEAQRRVDEERRAAEDARKRVEEERRAAEEARKRVEEERRAAEEARQRAAEMERVAEEARQHLQDELARLERERVAAIEAKAREAADAERKRIEENARRKFGYTLNVPTALADTQPQGVSAAAAVPPTSPARLTPLGALLGSFEDKAPTASREAVALDTPSGPLVGPPLQTGAPANTSPPTIDALRRADAVAPFTPPPRTAPSFLGPRPEARPLVPSEGSFGARADFAELLAEVVKQGVTGRVDFTSGTKQKSVVFESGRPVDAYSSQVFDRTEEYLLREGRITRAQYQEVRVKGLRSPRLIGSYLVNEGHLKPDELFGAVRGHLEDLIYSLFEWDEGTYVYVPEHALEDDRVMLDKDPRALVVEGIRRKYLLPRLLDKVGSPSTLLTRTDIEGRIDMDVLGLTLEEKQIARLVDGARNVDDIVFSSGVGALRVYQVLAALLACGAIEIAVRGIEGVNTAGATDLDSIDRKRIEERVELARHADYFTVLGVGRSATAYEVDLAFDRIVRDLAPNRLSPHVRDSLKPQLAEIERVLEDARDVLRDPRTRDAYARHLPA